MNMKALLLNNKMLVLIFCLGFILRLFFALNSQTPTIKDGILYDSVAVSLINGKGYTLDGQHPTLKVAPFYPLFLASIYSIFGYNFNAALIIQAIIGTLTCLLIYQLAMEIFKNKNVAITSGIISFLYYYFIREGERLWTEPLFMFLLILVVLYYVKMATYNKPFYAAIMGLFSAALTLTRPIALFLPFMLMGVEFFRIYLWNKQKLFVYMRYLGIVLFFFLLPISFWTIRNYAVQNEFLLVVTGGGRNFYEAFNPYEGKKYGITVVDEVIKQGELIPSEVLRDKYYFRKGLESISHKGVLELAKLTMIKGLTFWSLMDWGPMANGGVVFNFCTSFILPFVFFSFILLWSDKHLLMMPLLPVGYFFFFSLVFMGLPRFRLTIEPFLIILAAYSITWLFNRFSKKIIPTAIISLWLAVNFFLYINSENVKVFFKNMVKMGGLW